MPVKTHMSIGKHYARGMAETRTPTPPGIRGVLSRNVKAFMRARPEIGSQPLLERATGIPARTIGRILNGEQFATIEKLEELARGLRCEPWQLLVPDLDPAALPERRPQLTPFEQGVLSVFKHALEAAADAQSAEASRAQHPSSSNLLDSRARATNEGTTNNQKGGARVAKEGGTAKKAGG